MGNTGERQIDPLTGQQLERAQLVAGAGDRHRFIQRIAAQQLKLTQRRGTIVGDRRANARDHGVKMRELATFIVNRRGHRADVHITGKRIEDFHLVSAFLRGFAQAST